MSTIDQRLRRIITEDGRKLRTIARISDVPYMTFWSWFKGHQEKLDFVIAEKIHRALTGKGFGE